MEDTARLVVRALRVALDRGPLSVQDAVDIAHAQLERPGGPRSRLPDAARTRLHEALTALARSLDPAQPRSLLAFARAAAATAWSATTPPRHPGAHLHDAHSASARTLARAALVAEAAHALDAEDHVRRAVTRALRERKRSRGKTRLPLDDDDPLRVVLDVPARGRVVLPANDVRTRISRAAAHSPLGDALRIAARFSAETLRPALGEELWALGRPVGFADKACTRVLVETRSALLAQELSLRSQELLHRLRALPGFERVRGMKTSVL